MTYRTEDQVRDNARKILGFDDYEQDVLQGTGQITTFNQLGFKGVNDKPDGWYLPTDISRPAIVLETKSEAEDLMKEKWKKELFKNMDILMTRYGKVIGILYNRTDVRVFKNKIELSEVSNTL